MSVTKRSVKGSALTFEELDQNFQELIDLQDLVKRSGSGSSYAATISSISGGVVSEGARLTPGLRFLIGTMVDDGVNRLQVNGGAKIAGDLTLSNGTYSCKITQGSSYNTLFEMSASGKITWGNGAELQFSGTTETTKWTLNSHFNSNNANSCILAGTNGKYGFFTMGSSTQFNAIGSVFHDNNTCSLTLLRKTGGNDTEGARLLHTGALLIGATADDNSGALLQVAGGLSITTLLRINSPTTSMSASSGGGSALPANPAGYLSVNLGGTVYKMPYYAS